MSLFLYTRIVQIEVVLVDVKFCFTNQKMFYIVDVVVTSSVLFIPRNDISSYTLSPFCKA